MKIRGNTIGTPIRPERNLVKATNLTDEEKAQARANIGAAAVGEGGGNSTALTIIRNMLAKAVYTEDVSSLLTALDEAIANPGGGSDEPVEPDISVEEILSVIWIKSADNTTYEYEEYDISQYNTSATAYHQGFAFVQTETNGGVLHVNLDTSRLSKISMKMFMWDAQGNAYQSIVGDAGTLNNPLSGDISNLAMMAPGTDPGRVWINGSVTYNIPDGCRVCVVFNAASAKDYVLDEEIKNAAKPVYALVDTVTFKGEIVTAKIVKEV